MTLRICRDGNPLRHGKQSSLGHDKHSYLPADASGTRLSLCVPCSEHHLGVGPRHNDHWATTFSHRSNWSSTHQNQFCPKPCPKPCPCPCPCPLSWKQSGLEHGLPPWKRSGLAALGVRERDSRVGLKEALQALPSPLARSGAKLAVRRASGSDSLLPSPCSSTRNASGYPGQEAAKSPLTSAHIGHLQLVHPQSCSACPDATSIGRVSL